MWNSGCQEDICNIYSALLMLKKEFNKKEETRRYWKKKAVEPNFTTNTVKK